MAYVYHGIYSGAPTVVIDRGRMKQERLRLGLTQEALSALCRWRGKGRVSEYERGTRRPTVESLRRLEEALDVEPGWLT